MSKQIKMKSIKELRVYLKLTQQELAAKLKVGQPAISAWENQEYEPSLSTYKKILKLAKSKNIIFEID